MSANEKSEMKYGSVRATQTIVRCRADRPDNQRRPDDRSAADDLHCAESNGTRGLRRTVMKSEEPETAQSRRTFLGRAATFAAAALAVGARPFFGGMGSVAAGAVDRANKMPLRMNDCFNYRRDAAIAQRINVGIQRDNGDWKSFSDFSGNFSKSLRHDALGIPDRDAMLSLRRAFETGRQEDFANIIVGTPGGDDNSRLNGPQGALAFDLEGRDSHATVIPAAPGVTSAQTAAEMVEHYWAALIADVPFTEYATNDLVGEAVADMNSLSFPGSAANDQFPYPFTRQNLFRGQIEAGDGNVRGPYVSQFLVQPTSLGAQSLDQRYRTFLPEQAFMTSLDAYQNIQNGGINEGAIQMDPVPRYIRNGRDLAAYTHVDVLYQAYFTAFLVLSELGAAPNPGIPYISSGTQKAFGTLGGPDAVGTLAEMATRALKASWYHKWIKDLRLRPEEYGALVEARLTNASPMPEAAAALHGDVFNSAALPLIYAANGGTYLLPQAFPEGSPTHPCYPTGHGCVGGACITALKFFFNGSKSMRTLLLNAGRDTYEPSGDGLSLDSYSGSDADTLDIDDELNKLAHNISFGHGIHAGIHFRSSTYWSILLGEQVGLSILRDRAKSYNEPFSVDIKTFDGRTATISNR